MSRHATTPSLLRYPLPASKSDDHDLKRARLVKSESATDTIEDRILTGAYTSFHDLKNDVASVHNAILTDHPATVQNGSANSDIHGQLSKLLKVLDNYEIDASGILRANGEHTPTTNSVGQQAKQFLSLRSQVNGSAQILFSGLQIVQQAEKDEPNMLPENSGTSLPNGFQLTDFSTLGRDEDASKKQDKRNFEKVFLPARRIKPLDLPHTARDVVRGHTLDFIPNASRPANLPLNKHDYKFAKLPTGSWLSYCPSQQDRKKVLQSSSSTDFKAALAANSVRQGKDLDTEDMFASVYSSFAPSSDNAYSLVSEEDMTRQWWHQHGEQKLSRLLRPVGPEASMIDGEARGNDEFADLVDNFEPHGAEDDSNSDSADTEVDDLLNEISEMIETLSSYQRNRTLEPVASGTVPKPSSPEVDHFQLLRDQLRVLISSLPPFAVAKLNGDQLEELNISTRLVVTAPDYPGTGQTDDYVLRRQKMAQQATAAASRPTATPQPVRPNYSSITTNPIGYNSQVRNYNASGPATATYGARLAQNYQTPTVPRPTYSQTPLQASTANHSYSANRPTIQQFQRPPMQNGYGSFGSNTPVQPQPQSQSQTPSGYGQRPTQPGYQQRAQDNAAAVGRSASPPKPQGLVNGAQQHYAPRQYQTPQTPGQPSQTPYPYQRQSSGTPTTPIAPATMGARHDGATARPPSAQSGGITTPAHQTQQSLSQTVEVSR